MYSDLTVHQKISLKSLITSQKERDDMGINDHSSNEHLKSLYALKIIGSCTWEQLINYFLTDDIKHLCLETTQEKTDFPWWLALMK